ncbi:MAG TPA: leucine-rich repeat domain-containing protein, partial [Candidatus Angelobacter sp.]
GNQLSVLPDSIAQLTHLENLDLSGNQLTTLPGSIARLAHLRYLNLTNNRLTVIPSWLAELPNLSLLFLHGNPDLGIPDEILGPTRSEAIEHGTARPPREILAYLKKSEMPGL